MIQRVRLFRKIHCSIIDARHTRLMPAGVVQHRFAVDQTEYPRLSAPNTNSRSPATFRRRPWWWVSAGSRSCRSSVPGPHAERRAPQAAQHHGGSVELLFVIHDLAGGDQTGEDGADELALAIRRRRATIGAGLGGAISWRRLGDLVNGTTVELALGDVDVVPGAMIFSAVSLFI
jgi:hypothetical protein